MIYFFSLLYLSFSSNAPIGYYEHGRAFVTLLTCAEHTIGFDDAERSQIRNIAFDLSDAVKAIEDTDDLSFAAGMTDQQEQFSLDAANTQSFAYGSVSAQVSAYLTKDRCLNSEKQANELLKQLADARL